MADQFDRIEIQRNASQFGDECFPTLRIEAFKEGQEPLVIIRTLRDLGAFRSLNEASAAAHRIRIESVSRDGTFTYSISA